jgi:hypothetical protein
MTTKTAPHADQLELLTPTTVPLQFRLDRNTRRLGITRAAQMRQLLADQRARRVQGELGQSSSDAA